jgi:hypothetical protein
MSGRPNIYVTNRAAHDFTSARDFGDLVFLTEGLVDKFKTNKLYRLMKPIIESSEPEDFILVSGLTILSCIACAMFAVKHERLNLLIYDGRTHDYEPRRLDLSDLQMSAKDLLEQIKT